MKKSIVKNWQGWIFAALTLVFAVLVLVVNTPSFGIMLFMLIHYVIFSIVASTNKSPNSMIVTTVVAIMMWGICALGWHYVVMLIPVVISVIDAVLHNPLGTSTVLIMIIYGIVLSGLQTNREKSIAKLPENSIEATIQEFEK